MHGCEHEAYGAWLWLSSESIPHGDPASSDDLIFIAIPVYFKTVDESQREDEIIHPDNYLMLGG